MRARSSQEANGQAGASPETGQGVGRRSGRVQVWHDESSGYAATAGTPNDGSWRSASAQSHRQRCKSDDGAECASEERQQRVYEYQSQR